MYFFSVFSVFSVLGTEYAILKLYLLAIGVLRPNPEGFVYMSWKEREGGDMEGCKQ